MKYIVAVLIAVLLIAACGDDPLDTPTPTTNILPGANIPAQRVTVEEFCDGVRTAWGGDIDALIDSLRPMDADVEKFARDMWAKC